MSPCCYSYVPIRVVDTSIKMYTIGGMKRDNSRHIKSYKILGNNIRYQREIRNLSQEELAFRISSTRNYIGCIERAEKFPSFAIILDIKNALGCNINELIQNI